MGQPSKGIKKKTNTHRPHKRQTKAPTNKKPPGLPNNQNPLQRTHRNPNLRNLVRPKRRNRSKRAIKVCAQEQKACPRVHENPCLKRPPASKVKKIQKRKWTVNMPIKGGGGRKGGTSLRSMKGKAYTGRYQSVTESSGFSIIEGKKWTDNQTECRRIRF